MADQPPPVEEKKSDQQLFSPTVCPSHFPFRMELCADEILDAVEAAKSGHVGLPLGMALRALIARPCALSASSVNRRGRISE